MTWDGGNDVLRCDAAWYTGARKACTNLVFAATRDVARNLAAGQGWTRDRRAGSPTDLCERHSRGEVKV